MIDARLVWPRTDTLEDQQSNKNCRGSQVLSHMLSGLLRAVQHSGSRASATRRMFALLAFAGVLPGAQAQVAVSEGGTPVYSQAISVPPGVAGMSPKLGLFYAGGGVNGPVGHGWSVQGISSITRCPGVVAIDGPAAGRAVTNSPSDKLCLDGQRLIQTDAAGVVVAFPQANDSLGLSSGFREYRTEKDTFARVRAYGVANGSTANGPAYFKVWTKSGQIYEYGAGPAADANTKALISPYNKTVAVAWAVARISDTSGNYIDFKYEQRDVAWGSGPTAGSPTLGHEWNVSEIQYSGNKVIFSYIDRATRTPRDSAEAYHQGSKNVSVRLLQGITTYVNEAGTIPALGAGGGTPVKTTKLTYENGTVSGRSRVKTIQECAGGPSSTRCLPATSFSYASGGNDAYQASAGFNLTTLTLQNAAGTYGVLTGDFDADGKTDILRWSDNPSENQLYKSSGDGSFSPVTNFNITADKLFKADGCYATVVADMNGDGLSDLLRYSGPTDMDGAACSTYGATYIFFNNGDGTFNKVALTGPTLSRSLPATLLCAGVCPSEGGHNGWTAASNFFLLDVDGDGTLEIVTATLPQYNVYDEASFYCTGVVVCTRVYRSVGNGNFVEIPTNLANRSMYNPPKRTTGFAGGRNVADVNGDGLADFVGLTTRYLNTAPILVSRGDGNFDPAGVGSSCLYPIDFNGDGRSDCLSPGGNGVAASNKLLVADGSGLLPLVADFNLVNAGQEITGPNTPTGDLFPYFVVADINGDGRHDILRWKDDATQNAVFLSNGDGTFTPSGSFNLKTSTYQLRTSDGTTDFISGDFTGRGTTELLRLKASPTVGSATSNQLYVKTDPTPADQLVSVTTGTGATTTLYYVPLSNSTPSNGVSASYGARYTNDRGTANAATGGKIDLGLAMYVVATSVADNGVGSATVATEYGYLGLKADMTGRGLLGFREVRRQGKAPDGSNLTSFTQYLQGHPYTGVASTTSTRLGTLNDAAAPLLSSIGYTYCDKTALAGSEAAAAVGAPCPVPATAKVQRPYLRKSDESGYDLSGVALPQVVTTNSFNDSGDPTQIDVVTGTTFTKATTNVYQADDTAGNNWILGRLSKATVLSTVPNSLPTTSAGTGTNATATVGTGPLTVGALSDIAFGSVGVNVSSTRTATLTNSGIVALGLTVPTAASVTGTNFSFVSTTCTTTLAAGANCTVSVKFQPTAAVTRSGALSVVTGGGTLTATLSGTGLGSIVSVTTNNASALSATKGGASATGTVTFSNSGYQSATLTMSGLSGVYSVSPTSCTVAVSGTCVVTVTMTTGGAIGAQGAQTLTATGGSSGVATASVSGTLNGSSVATTTNNASALSATKGGANATGTVTFTNSGNQSATLTMSGLSGVYSVSPTSCTAAAGGTCVVTVTMTTGGAVGAQGAQTLTATGGSTGVATASVNGTLVGSIATLTSAAALNLGSVDAATTAPQAAWTFRNDGTSAMTLSLSTLNSPFSVVSNGCTSVAPAGTCTITARMATTATGSFNQVSISTSGASQGNRSDLSLTGTVTVPKLKVTLSSAGTATATWTVKNVGVAPSVLTALGTTGGGSVATTSCAVGSSIATGATCTVDTNNGEDCQGPLPYYLTATNSAGTAQGDSPAYVQYASCGGSVITPPPVDGQ